MKSEAEIREVTKALRRIANNKGLVPEWTHKASKQIINTLEWVLDGEGDTIKDLMELSGWVKDAESHQGLHRFLSSIQILKKLEREKGGKR